MILDDLTSRSLILRVQARDDDAWTLFVPLYGPAVYGWARRAGLADVDAADVTQDVFTSLLRQIDRFRYADTASTFRGWLRTVTRNEVRMFWRRGRRQTALERGQAERLEQQQHVDPEIFEDDGPQVGVQLAHRAVALIRGEFENTTWQAFWRTVVDGQPATEVAAEMGISAGAVRQAKYRVLCRARELLGDGGG